MLDDLDEAKTALGAKAGQAKLALFSKSGFAPELVERAASEQGVLVLSSGGNCPLGPLLRRLGDDAPFFELFLPPRAAKVAVPVLAAVAALGAVLLAARTP